MYDDLRVSVPVLADAADIILWSNRTESRTELPRLVRRLIQENNDQVTFNNVRSGEGTGTPGFDGTVTATVATPFVPDGASIWEMGTDAVPQSKANSDYKTRTDALGTGVVSDEVFVFVTSRRWPRKQEWETNKRAEKRWRDVRAFDVDDIEQALESAPSVHVWFSELVGKPARGAQSLEHWWRVFSTRTNPVLTPELILAGREDTAQELIRLLQQDRPTTIVGSKSADDDLAFVVASILSTEGDLQSKLLSRSVIVRDSHALRWLANIPDLIVIVPPEESLRRAAELTTSHVVFLSEEDAPCDISLRPIHESEFARQLVEAGVSESEARRLALGAHRSIRRFQRLAAKAGSLSVQDWREQLRSRNVRRAWLCGGWNSSKTGDTDVLSTVFGQEYREVANELWAAGRVADPLFTHVGDRWAVIDPEDSWEYCRAHLNVEDLRAVEAAIQTVLGAVDPALELPVEDRWMAAIYNKSRAHSTMLREGLATTLALLGSFGQSISLGEGNTGRTWAERIVFGLLGRANDDPSGDLWASLTDVMPLLAEAAPSVFAQAVQVGLEGDPPVLATQFLDQTDHFSVSSPHTGLLWALETLAWSGEHVSLVVDLLARLAEVDPGGKLTNRPLASMTNILRPWYPRTSASVERRKSVLAGVLGRHPDVGWSLLLQLLPDRSGFALPSHEPNFRKWKPEQEGVTQQEYSDFVEAVAEHVFSLLGHDPAKWTAIAPRLSDFPHAHRQKLFKRLEELAHEDLTDKVRADIVAPLGKELRRHRSYADAAWSLPASDLDKLDAVLATLEPPEPMVRHKWLFDDQFPDVGESRKGNFDVYAAEVLRLRDAAVREMLASNGMSGLLELAELVGQPWALGSAVGGLSEVDPTSVVELLDSENPNLVQFAHAYVLRASNSQLDWLMQHANSCPTRPRVQARLLAICDDLQSAWGALEVLGREAENLYWSEFGHTGRGPNFLLVNESARRLLAHGRPTAALALLSLYLDHNENPVDPELAAEALESLIATDDPEVQSLSSWEIERLLDFIRGTKLDLERISLLEWRLLPAIGIERHSPILERRLARDPSFFVEVLSLAYKPHTERTGPEVDPRVAVNAYRLLQDWTHLPGNDSPGGEVDPGRLGDWLAEAERRAIDADRLAISRFVIGQVFGRSAVDYDGSWPSLAIRAAIERIGSTDLERGVYNGVVNGRGVTSRNPAEGGNQERELAARYDKYAEIVADQWPRTGAILRALADGFRSEARSHDDDAERLRHGLER